MFLYLIFFFFAALPQIMSHIHTRNACLLALLCFAYFAYSPLSIFFSLYHIFRPLPRRDDRDAQPAVRALQDELLVPPGLYVVADGPDEDEPADDHEDVGDPVAAGDVVHGPPGGALVAGADRVRVEVVAVRVRRLRVAVRGAAAVHAAARRRPLHVEPVLDKCDAKPGARPVLRRVRRVQEVGEQETDQLEGHADHAVPDETEYGSDGHPVDVYFIGTAEARG